MDRRGSESTVLKVQEESKTLTLFPQELPNSSIGTVLRQDSLKVHQHARYGKTKIDVSMEEDFLPWVCTSESSLPDIDSSPRGESYSFVYHTGDETSAVQSGSGFPVLPPSPLLLSSLPLLFHRPSSLPFSPATFLPPLLWPAVSSRRTIDRVRIDPLRLLVHISSARSFANYANTQPRRHGQCTRICTWKIDRELRFLPFFFSGTMSSSSAKSSN